MNSLIVVVGLIRKDDRILLVEQQAPHDPESGWALPGGRAEPGELLIEALAREVREETGLEIQGSGQLIYYAQHHNPFGVFDAQGKQIWQPGLATMFVFQVAEWSGELCPRDPEGWILQTTFLPVENAIAKLVAIPLRVMRDPIVSYLRGDVNAGAMWFYRRQNDGQDALIVKITNDH